MTRSAVGAFRSLRLLPARPLLRRVGRGAVVVALTFFGLLLVTFLIGRVVPIDPVLAAVGDRDWLLVYEMTRT